MGNLLNALDFGAKGDGVANDADAVQAALNTGKSVYLPKGAYLLSAPLVVVSGQTLAGDHSLLMGAGVTLKDTELAHIQGLHIQPKAGVPCISDSGSTQLRISDCTLERGEYGLLLNNTRAAVVDNCVIQANNRGTAQTGIRAVGGATPRLLSIRDCHFENNPTGIDTDMAYETLVDNCSFQGGGFDKLIGRMTVRGGFGGSGTLISKRVNGAVNGFISDAANITPVPTLWTPAGATPPTLDTSAGHTKLTFPVSAGGYGGSRAYAALGSSDGWLDVTVTLKSDRAGVSMIVRALAGGNADARILSWLTSADWQTLRFQVAAAGAAYVVIHPAALLSEAVQIDIGVVTHD